jgi:Multi-copper polyphenol oxidoreductase laccase
MHLDLSKLGPGYVEPKSLDAVRDFVGTYGWTARGLDLTPAAGKVVSRLTGTTDELDELHAGIVPGVLGARMYLPTAYPDRTERGNLRSPWDGELVAKSIGAGYSGSLDTNPNPRTLCLICPPNSATGVMRADAPAAIIWNRRTGTIGSGLLVWHALRDDLVEQFVEAMCDNGSNPGDLFVVMGAGARQKFYLDRDGYELMVEGGDTFDNCMERVFGLTRTKSNGTVVPYYVNLDLGRLAYLLFRDADVPFDQIDFDSQCTRTTRDEAGTLLLASKRNLDDEAGPGSLRTKRKPGALLAGSSLAL